VTLLGNNGAARPSLTKRAAIAERKGS
jgi:hypothetical protein